MKSQDTKLPPTWVKAFSCLFTIYLLVPVLAFWQIREAGSPLGVAAFGVDLKGDRDPLAWILAFDVVLFLGGLTGLLILRRQRFAYDFGIGYCVVTLGVTLPAHLVIPGGNPWSGLGAAIQYPLLILFLVHLIRNRRGWNGQCERQSGASSIG